LVEEGAAQGVVFGGGGRWRGFAEHLVEGAFDGGGAAGAELVGVDQVVDQQSCGAELGDVVGRGEVLAEGFDAGGDGREEVAGDVFPEVALAAGELGDEGGVVAAPAVEGLGVDLQGAGDGADRFACQEAGEGGLLAGG
jgi:hypothetical protein